MLPTKDKPKAILFDMDGVLYDSMPNHAICWQEAMKSFGLEMSQEEVYETEGMRGVETIQALVKAQKGVNINEAEAQRMYDEKARLFELRPKAKIFEGILPLFQLLKDKGITIVIVTGSAQRPLIKRLEQDFTGFLTEDKIVSAYDVTRGKPAPEPYLKGLQKAGGILPREAIVVENAPMGIRSGVAAGIKTIAINSGPLPDEHLLKEGASHIYPTIIDFFKDIKQFLK